MIGLTVPLAVLVSCMCVFGFNRKEPNLLSPIHAVYVNVIFSKIN